jgi:hypothetical protein
MASQKKTGPEYMVDKISEKEINLNFSEGDILPLQSLRDLLANDSISHPTRFIYIYIPVYI